VKVQRLETSVAKRELESVGQARAEVENKRIREDAICRVIASSN
jgi:hypothetical protein